jgi:uncharacterized membrane protein
MKPLIVLISVFAILLVADKLVSNDWNSVFAGNTAMSVMLGFTAMGHFLYFRGMIQMLPSGLPFKKEIIFLTGIIEIVAAAGLLIPSVRQLTAWLLIVFLIVVLPANILAAKNEIDYQKANAQGPGLNYLWFRIPLQIFFIAWIAYFGIFRF